MKLSSAGAANRYPRGPCRSRSLLSRQALVYCAYLYLLIKLYISRRRLLPPACPYIPSGTRTGMAWEPGLVLHVQWLVLILKKSGCPCQYRPQPPTTDSERVYPHFYSLTWIEMEWAGSVITCANRTAGPFILPHFHSCSSGFFLNSACGGWCWFELR